MRQERRRIVLDGTVAHWRAHARSLALEGTPPECVRWLDPTRAVGRGDLFSRTEPERPTPVPRPPLGAPTLRVPRAFEDCLDTVGCHSDPDTWELLYRLLMRLQPRAGSTRVRLDDPLDPDVAELERRARAVRRDAHKMHAFVRFRRVESPHDPNGERFIAWHHPLHRIARREASFFRQRFPTMAWSILTPHASVHWDTREQSFGPGLPASAAPEGDSLEALWVRYYSAIFNPARVKLTAMRAEMPKHHWETLPETRAIPEMLERVPERLASMASSSRARADSAAPFVPRGGSLSELRSAASSCDGCELADDHTRVVFGEGPVDAGIVLLGEQPGDEEERAGRPFVGPAGELLDGLLARAELARSSLYLTNAVKHFRHQVGREPRKRRIHKRPGVGIVSRCQPWLDAELELLQPRVLVCLGTTAARAVFGPTFRPRERRGQVQHSRYAAQTVATYHPAAALRAPTAELRARIERDLVEALRIARRLGSG